jgi:hypothetical protein
MQTTDLRGDSKPPLRSRAIPHPGRCSSERTRCWSEACRAAFGEYATLEWLPWAVLAHCHGRAYDRLEALTRLAEAAA